MTFTKEQIAGLRNYAESEIKLGTAVANHYKNCTELNLYRNQKYSELRSLFTEEEVKAFGSYPASMIITAINKLESK